jgi:NADH:ubiquinone oxidoreductase subunit 5 (subunit L)/multisubunit Na+/H+ antiporter MnhA subunit
MVFFRRYFVDEIYYAIFLGGFRRLCHHLWKMDGKVIDGAVNGVAHLVLGASATSSTVDERVVDGAVNGVAHLVLGASATSSTVDERVVDGAVNGVATLALGASATSRRLHTGVVQHYILALALGIFVIAILYLLFP